MSSSFRVYIDESGDEGFKFRPNAGGSSEWFVLSSVVVRTDNDQAIVRGMEKARVILGKQKNHPLHFAKLTHTHRLAWVKEVAKLPVRTVSILVHKPNIESPEYFSSSPYSLYRYCSRLLMERVSWLLRDRHEVGRGDGTSEICFSHRRTMSYADVRDYWQKLKEDNAGVRICWKHVDPAKISAVSNEKLAGLQVADCVASAYWQAASLDRYGNNEPRYFTELGQTFYSGNSTAIGYGIKFWPDLKTLRPSMLHLAAFDGL